MDYSSLGRVFSITPDQLGFMGVVDVISQGASPIAQRLLAKAGTFNPVSDREPIKKARTTNQGSFSGLDSMGTAAQDNLTYAKYEPRAIYTSVVKVGLEEDVNALSGASGLDYEAVQMKLAAEDFRQLISEQIWLDGTGNTNKDMIGLALGVDSSGTYAGIARTTVTQWAASEYDISATSHSASIANSDNGFNILRRILNGGTDSAGNTITRTVYGGQRPTMFVTTQSLWAAFEALYSMVQTGSSTALGLVGQYNAQLGRGVADKFAQGPALAGQAGLQALYFSGIPIIYDENCPSGSIYALNENFLEFKGIPSVKKGAVNYDLNKGPIEVDGANKVEKSMGVTWTGFKDPFAQYGQAGQFMLHGVIKVRNPKFFGKVLNVTV